MTQGGDDQRFQQWFEGVWSQREDVIYRGLFGNLGQGVYTASEAVYQRFQRKPLLPGWLHHGVFACPPDGPRKLWAYVTSGLSNPWNLSSPGRDPSGQSGLGFELCLLARGCSDWAVPLLHQLMAWQLLVGTGALPGQPLDQGQRVPLGGAIDGNPATDMTWALVEAPDFSPRFKLPSGDVDWLLLVGITDREVQFARTKDQKALVALLRDRGVWPATEPSRASVA